LRTRIRIRLRNNLLNLFFGARDLKHAPHFFAGNHSMKKGLLVGTMAVKRNKPGIPFLCFALFMGAPLFGFAGGVNSIVLDYTHSVTAPDLTSQLPTVYIARKSFDDSKFSDDGEITQSDFADLTEKGLKRPKENIRFKIKKNDEMDVYIVTSIRMDTFEEAVAPATPPLQWVSDSITFVTSNSSRRSGPVTTSSSPITLSILKTARFLLREQQRPTSLESGDKAKVSAVFGVTFKAAALPLGPEEKPPSSKVYYYYRQKYRLKFESSVLNLSFEDQNGNQENVATVISGASENWFLMAGGPLYAYNPDTHDSSGKPEGLYLGLNWTPNDIFDPDPRLLIVNVLDVDTTNPSSAIGLVGLGMGFPKITSFIPLSTLSVTETLAYNLNLSKFQFLTMINYDVTDVLQLLKL
jgi:hypothetical protein